MFVKVEDSQAVQKRVHVLGMTTQRRRTTIFTINQRFQRTRMIRHAFATHRPFQMRHNSGHNVGLVGLLGGITRFISRELSMRRTLGIRRTRPIRIS